MKSSNKGEQLVSSKLPVPDVNVDAPIISSPLVGPIASNELGSEIEASAKLQNDEAITISAKEDGSTEAANCSESPEDAEKIRLKQAATKAQVAFRVLCILLYLCHLDDLKARREFRSLKGLIVLQAHVRGHLVRRQAVSTLSCVKGIVKFQTLVRHHKLLDSLPTAVPLHLQYVSREPNSATLWLERWTISRFWELFSEQKENSELKSRRKHESSRSIETEQDKSKKRSSRLSGAKVEIGSDSEKRNRNPRKVLSLPNAQPKRKMRKPLGSAAPDISEPEAKVCDSTEKLKDIEFAANRDYGENEDIKELNQELSYKDDCIRNDSQKTSQRRASLPPKFDPQENVVHDTPKLPSYMAATESAKARLRGQGSRLSRDVVEKNALLRRHSLSSSTNSMLTSLSPRASKLVQVTGKGVIRGDRSLSSSRDGGDKLIQAEWRR
ncbi:hypothetical protein CsatA_014985 [Cannabis sativa]